MEIKVASIFKFGRCLSVLWDERRGYIKQVQCSSRCEFLLTRYLMESELLIESIVQGHHIYKDVWNLSNGEEEPCKRR